MIFGYLIDLLITFEDAQSPKVREGNLELPDRLSSSDEVFGLAGGA